VNLFKALMHNSDNLCELWHKRMGHLHHRALPILREIVTGPLQFNIEYHGVCRGCLLGKHAKAAFPIYEYSDVCRSMSVASITRSMHYVSFSNDFPRKTWIYFLKTPRMRSFGFRSSNLYLKNKQRRRSKP
jgi:hypothetical protein